MSVKTDNFINQIGPLAQQDMQATGVLASLTIAQAILESAWGECELAVNANNLFGIKASADWKGATYTRETRKYINNEATTVSADFKAYNSLEESISDHSSLLQKDRYAKVLQATDYKVACEEVYKAGYATDPNYPQKLINLIEQYDLHQYDKSMTTNETGLTLYYRVVVGSYANRFNAEAQQQALQKEEIDSFLAPFTKDNVDYLRVVAGSYTSQDNALKQQETLKAKGFESFLVAEYI